MKKIYRKAAELIAERKEDYCCVAITKSANYSNALEKFEELYFKDALTYWKEKGCEEMIAQDSGWFKNNSTEFNTDPHIINARILALLFAAEFYKDL